MTIDSRKQQTLSAYQYFLNTSLDRQLQESLDADERSAVVSLFQTIAKTVPAYKMFLNERSIDPESIRTLEQFKAIPSVDKENYIQQYPLAQRCRHGKLTGCDAMAASSGSTGEPTLWPRSFRDELQIATRFEQIFHDSFEADRKTTLAVVCFSLGTWVGGMYTASCCRYLAQKGYPITVVTPGSSSAEILRLVKALGDSFEQVVLLGYPPFLKDAIDTGKSQNIDWPKYQTKLVMAGEVFSEEWRDLVGERLGSKHICYDSASLYGTADAGVLGNETPLSICIRRFLAANPAVARELFGESRLPTLVQYDPSSRFFEVQQGRLIFSGDNGVPLLRYSIKDTGGLITYDEMLKFLANYRFNPIAELQEQKARDQKENSEKTVRGIRPFPFVYVFGRYDFTVSYFGANIYPENVAVGLEQPLIRDWVTGKFVMQVKEGKDRNRYLSVVVELAPESPKDIITDEQKVAMLTDAIRAQLIRLNSEFANYVPQPYQTPVITVAPMGDTNYFPVGVKHRYTRQFEK